MLEQVPRDYAAFEKLQKGLMASYPELKFPSLPRKFHVFMDDSDIEERQFSFDCIVQVVAKSTAIATSIPVLQFLGFDPLADRKYFKVLGNDAINKEWRCYDVLLLLLLFFQARRKYLQEREEKAAKEKEKDKTLFGDRSEQINKGLFGSNGEGGKVEKKDTSEKDAFEPFEGLKCAMCVCYVCR